MFCRRVAFVGFFSLVFSLFFTLTKSEQQMCSTGGGGGGGWTPIQSACSRPLMSVHFKDGMAKQICDNFNGVLCKAPVNEEQNNELFREICPHFSAVQNGRSPVQLSLPFAHGMDTMLCFHGQPTGWGGQQQQAWMMPSTSAAAFAPAQPFPFHPSAVAGQMGQMGASYPSPPGAATGHFVSNGQMDYYSNGQQQQQSIPKYDNIGQSSVSPTAPTTEERPDNVQQKTTTQKAIAAVHPSSAEPVSFVYSHNFSSSFSHVSVMPENHSSSAQQPTNGMATLSTFSAANTTFPRATDSYKNKSASSPSYLKKILNRFWG